MLRDISLWQILIVVGLVVVLFGAKRLPDVTRSVTKSLRIFKTEIKDLRDDDSSRSGTARTSSDDAESAPAPLEGRAVDDARRAERDEQHRAS